MKERKSIVFLSSSFVNLAKMFAENSQEYDIFLINDRKVPHEFEDMDNFYAYTFDKNKIFDKNQNKYFDTLAVYIQEFEPDVIVTNNFTKLLPTSFIEFVKFRNKNIQIINLHHADLREGDKYKGLNADVKQFLEEGEIITTIHKIEDGKMDEGEHLDYSYHTDLKELKQKGFVHKKEDIINLRIRNVILSYHERTKVLSHLKKVIDRLVSS